MTLTEPEIYVNSHKKTPALTISTFSRLLLILTVLSIPLHVTAQTDQNWLTAEQEYKAGIIDINTLVDRQLRIIEDQSAYSGEVFKCATPTFIRARAHWDELSAKTKEKINSSGPLSSAAEIYVSVGGKFEIHYETSGVDAVPPGDENANTIPDYVEWVAEAADSSYNHEVLTLGFTDPIPDGERYKIFISDLSFYGLTRTDGSEPAGTHIEIENDFAGFPPNTDPQGDQRGAVRVTMAHEFKHAIQFAQNNWSGSSNQWAEMDATLYEEVVYDDVNDYYNYLDGFADNLFLEPQTTLVPGSYEDITWALYFEEKYGTSFWREVWDLIETEPLIDYTDAIGQTLQNYNMTFDEAMLESVIWHFTSGGTFSTADFGFEESAFYPSPTIFETIPEYRQKESDTYIQRGFSANYFVIEPEVLSSGKLRTQFSSSSSSIQFGLVLYDYFDGSISTYYFTNLDPQSENSFFLNDAWTDIQLAGLIVVNTDPLSSASFSFLVSDYFETSVDTVEIVQDFELEQNYPNPFNPSTNIRINLSTTQQVKLTVYDNLGRMIATLFEGSLNRGFHNFQFNAGGLSSGIYYYKVESESGTQIKKMTLIK